MVSCLSSFPLVVNLIDINQACMPSRGRFLLRFVKTSHPMSEDMFGELFSLLDV